MLLAQQLAQGAIGPELDVAAVPERGEVAIERTQRRQRKILEIAVIRRREHQRAAWPQQARGLLDELSRRIQVLDDFSGDDYIPLAAEHGTHVITHRELLDANAGG